MKNKNVIIVEKDVQIAKGVFLSEGDALVKTRNGWTLIEAEGDEYEKEKEVEVEESDDEGMDDGVDDESDVDEKKKK
jgi:hypothetical protein